MLNNILLLFYVATLTLLIYQLYILIIYKIGLLDKNYRGDQIPISMGLVIPFVYITTYPILFQVSYLTASYSKLQTYLIVTTSLGMIGFIDDWIGNQKIKGLRGHLLYFLEKKRISTGMVKLIWISTLGLIISLRFQNSLIEVIIATLTFAVWTNLINLLDVRPGRAIKGFWILFLLIFLLNINYFQISELVFLVISLILYEADRREFGMLGDAGANVLGGIIGSWLVMWATTFEGIIFLIVGIWITFYAERYSINKWIEAHPMIKHFDHWGRKIID